MADIKPPQIKTAPDRTVAVPTALKYKADDTPRQTSKTYPDKRKLRAEFKSEEFARAIAQHGKHVIWRKALLCPCFKEDLQQPDPNCARCDGSGYFYVDPIAIQAVILSVDQKMNMLERQGAWLSGRSMITVDADHRIGYRDSLQMRDSIMSFDEYLKKGNRRGIRAQLPAGKDSARYRIVNVTYLLYLDKANKVHELKEKQHFVIDGNGWIEWLTAGNKLVADAAMVSIRYEYHPAYVIESHPHAIRDDFESKKTGASSQVTSLPLQAVALLDYLVNDTPKESKLPSTW